MTHQFLHQHLWELSVSFLTATCLKNQVTAVCQSAHFHLYNIGRIRKCITYDACEKIIHAFATSRLDCGNAVLIGLPASQLTRLQCMLHIAARILTLTPKFEHITPILMALHWLPVPQRMEYKIIILTFKAMHGQAPVYLSELLKPHDTGGRALRSSDTNLLYNPKRRTSTFGDRAFANAAPPLWNGLPNDLRKIINIDHFKSALKTFLFKAAYSDWCFYSTCYCFIFLLFCDELSILLPVSSSRPIFILLAL